ncbi:MAG: hypothetical protein KC468_24165, partial [Myxococcales bacterium]|nr:hypothetical protein [Myxococcales bacterium]
RARLSRDIARERVFHWFLPDGASTCLLGLGEPTRHSARVALVYTPLAQRGRGYASAAVRALSERCLAAPQPVARCTLHTDVRNPVAERIYRRLGYRYIADSRTYSLDP